MMESDSDRTIDSDELDEMIKKAESEKFQSSSNEKQHTKQKHKAKLHDISDSDSEPEVQKRKIVKTDKVKCDEKSITDTLPKCRYGKECYRKNPDHLKNFSHTFDDTINESLVDKPCNSEENEANLPKHQDYGFYVTKVHGISEKYNYGFAQGIQDLLSVEKGQLIASAQFNYMIDIPWLMQQYPAEFRSCPLTIVHGEQREAKRSLEKSGADFSNIKFCQAKLDIPFGTHHTKMMFLLYKEGFRVIIHTSNLVHGDWFQKTQGMWVSPLLPKLKTGPSTTEGESPTRFKFDLLEYVSSYGVKGLEEWCMTIRSHDFSKVRVFLIGSSPGRHTDTKRNSFGHLKLRKVLNLYGPDEDCIASQWPLVGQFSSIGSLGATPDQWLCGEWSASLATIKGTSMNVRSSLLKLVFPSVENVRKSLEGYPAGASLPYSHKVAVKQTYLNSFLHQWKSDKLGRTEASPHIKTYLRVSPDYKNIAWFLVTSANLSKAAWGALEKKGAQFMIRSYELGVLFLPQNFGMEVFSVPSSTCKDINTIFPIPYDIPLEPYSKQDEPWTWDVPHIRAPDRNGNKWCPS